MIHPEPACSLLLVAADPLAAQLGCELPSGVGIAVVIAELGWSSPPIPGRRARGVGAVFEAAKTLAASSFDPYAVSHTSVLVLPAVAGCGMRGRCCAALGVAGVFAWPVVSPVGAGETLLSLLPCRGGSGGLRRCVCTSDLVRMDRSGPFVASEGTLPPVEADVRQFEREVGDHQSALSAGHAAFDLGYGEGVELVAAAVGTATTADSLLSER